MCLRLSRDVFEHGKKYERCVSERGNIMCLNIRRDYFVWARKEMCAVMERFVWACLRMKETCLEIVRGVFDDGKRCVSAVKKMLIWI